MLKHYLLISIKVLLRRKFFTLISLAGISLTLMILIVYSASFDNLLGKIPPETRGERTLCALRVDLSGKDNRSISYTGYQFLTEYVKIHTLPGIECSSLFTVPEPVETVYGNRMFQTQIKLTDGNFWKILDFEFTAGGPFTGDDERNARYVAVINTSLRKKLFGKASGIGESITVNGRNYRVVGVVKDVSALRQIPFAEIWAPLTTSKTGAYRNDGVFGNFTGIVLAKSRVDIPRIKQEYSTRVSRLDYPIPDGFSTANGRIETYFEFMTREISHTDLKNESDRNRILMILVGAMFLFMALPALNLININLSRILERSSEIGVRKAFGASSRILAFQFLVENMILTLLGGCIGLVLSLAILHAVNSFRIIPYVTFHFNGRIFVYGLIMTLVFGILSGVYPAWKMSRYHPVEALRKSPME